MEINKRLVRSLIVTIWLLCIGNAFAAPSIIEQSSDLIGEWVLCHDEDGGTKDTMEFYEEGYGFSVRPNKPKTPFLYKDNGKQVLLAVNSKGKMFSFYLEWSDDHSRLTLTNQRNGNLAYYVPMSKVQNFECTAK